MTDNIHSGIIRRVDDLGRVVIPKELRQKMRIHENDPLEIALSTTNDGAPVIVISRYIIATQRTAGLCDCALKAISAPENCAVSVVDMNGRFIDAKLCVGDPAAKSALFSLETKIARESEMFRHLSEYSFKTDDATIALNRFSIDGEEGYIASYIPNATNTGDAAMLRHDAQTTANFISLSGAAKI